MSLIKREYTDEETLITAKNLNDIQDAVLALEDGLFVAEDSKSGEVITITDASKRSFSGFNIYGKTTQNGTPTPDNPVELVNIGKGSITVNVAGEKASQSMTIETPNGLPGIPVASGGNYTDANGQRWICDEIDLARGVYIKRTNRLTLNGSEGWGLYSFQSQYFGFALYNALESSHSRAKGWCNQFRVGNNTDNSVWVGVGNTGLYVITSEWHGKGMEAWKEHLAASPLVVIYPSTTTTETALTEEELAAYAALHTYKNYTTVSNDAGAWMDVEYILDAKKYIDNLALANGVGPGAPVIARFTLAEELSNEESTYRCENYTHDDLVAMMWAGRVVFAHLSNGSYRRQVALCKLNAGGHGTVGTSDEVLFIDPETGSVWLHNPQSSRYFDDFDREIWIEE